MPDLTFWGTGFARGSAIGLDRTINNINDGWRFSRYNYGFGFQVSIPILDFASTSQKIRQHDLMVRYAEEHNNQVVLELQKEENIATATLSNVIESAELSREFLETAQYAYNAMNARYEAGLTNLLSLLDAQQQLRQAEAEIAKSQAELWKALLYKAAVMGDISLFIAQTR